MKVGESVTVIPEMQRKELLRELAGTTVGAEFICNSGSMRPTIQVGDAVRVHAVSVRDLRIGDVVVFEGDGNYILHRIVWVLPGLSWFLHIGDAPDECGPRRARVSSIVGRSSHVRRWPPLRVYRQAFRRFLRSLPRR